MVVRRSTYGATKLSPVAVDLCPPEETAARTRRCNTRPCGEFRWAAHAWGPCNATCGGGAQRRPVR